MNREVLMFEAAEAIERKLGAIAAEPYHNAYRRMVYTDRYPISDAQVDRLLAKAQQRLAS